MAHRFIFNEGHLETVSAGPIAGDGAGARGDGQGSAALILPCGEDDAPEVRRALAEHACVRLAPGAFTLGSPVMVPPGRTLAGSGPDHTTLRVGHAAGDALAAATTAEGSATIEKLMLIAPPGSPADQHGIAVRAAEGRLTLRALEIRGFGGDGVRVDGACRVEIEGVEVYDVGGDGVALRDVERAWSVWLRVHGAQGCGVRVAVRGVARLTELDVAEAAAGLAVEACRGRVVVDSPRFHGCHAELRIAPGADVVLDGRAAGQ
jgi:hypothetical protein